MVSNNREHLAGGANVGEEELYPGNAFSPLCSPLQSMQKQIREERKDGSKAVLCLPGGRRGGRTWLSNISSRKYAEKVTGLVGWQHWFQFV